jgi:hypothetical protein
VGRLQLRRDFVEAAEDVSQALGKPRHETLGI